MAIVENNVVKMEWDKSGWLQTSARGGKQPVFILASKDYESKTHGTLSVIFTAETAFLFIDDAGTDDEDIWTAQDLISTIKSDMPGYFPYSLNQYTPIINSGEAECNMDVLEKYGLTEYKDDIEKRQMDIAPYGYETDVKTQ
jgi:hypothetical protein